MNPSRFEIYKDDKNAGFKIEGFINTRDLIFQPEEIIFGVKQIIISKLADKVLDKLMPEIDKAISSIFKEHQHG